MSPRNNQNTGGNSILESYVSVNENNANSSNILLSQKRNGPIKINNATVSNF
jgi:hypothetical protein